MEGLFGTGVIFYYFRFNRFFMLRRKMKNQPYCATDDIVVAEGLPDHVELLFVGFSNQLRFKLRERLQKSAEIVLSHAVESEAGIFFIGYWQDVRKQVHTFSLFWYREKNAYHLFEKSKLEFDAARI